MTKDNKWLQTRLDRSVTKDAEKEEKLNHLLDKIEKQKEAEMDFRRQIQDRENQIREMKILI